MGSLSIFGVSIYSYWREAGHYGQFIIFFLIYITPTCIIFILFWILPAWALIRGISKRQFNMFIPWILSMLLNSSAFLFMAYYYPISPLFSYLLSSFVILFLLPVQILVWVEAKKCRQEHIQVYWYTERNKPIISIHGLYIFPKTTSWLKIDTDECSTVGRKQIVCLKSSRIKSDC